MDHTPIIYLETVHVDLEAVHVGRNTNMKKELWLEVYMR